MKLIQCSRNALNPISLPGMGRSIELEQLPYEEVAQIQSAFSTRQLYVSFDDAPEEQHAVINLWANPHSTQMTLFIK